LIVSFIRDRFSQPGYKAYINLEDLLRKAARCEDFTAEYSFVTSFYKDDFNSFLLKIHLELFGTFFSRLGIAKPTLRVIKDYFKDISPAIRSSTSEVCTLLKLIMVLPATNAVNEQGELKLT